MITRPEPYLGAQIAGGLAGYVTSEFQPVARSGGSGAGGASAMDFSIDTNSMYVPIISSFA